MRRTLPLWILALSLVAGACSDESPRVAKIDEMKVVKVSGDQASPVPSAASPVIYATAGASLQLLDADGYTPEPLVAQVMVEGGAGIMSGGPVVPKGTETHWHIEEGGGKLYGDTRLTDDTAHVVNRWAPGTRAGTYRATAGRIVGTAIVTDSEWELVVEPGPVSELSLHPLSHVQEGDNIDIRSLLAAASDKHRNAIPLERVRSLPAANNVWWAWPVDGEPTHYKSGWTTAVPDLTGYTGTPWPYEVFPGDGEPQWIASRDGASPAQWNDYTITYYLSVDPEHTGGAKVELLVRAAGIGWYQTAVRTAFISHRGQITTYNTNLADNPTFGLMVKAGGTIDSATVSWRTTGGEQVTRQFMAGRGGVPTRHFGTLYTAPLEVQIHNSKPARTSAVLYRCANGLTPSSTQTCSELH